MSNFVFSEVGADFGEGDPDFAGPISNVTVALGREAILTCSVTQLAHYKVMPYSNHYRVQCPCSTTEKTDIIIFYITDRPVVIDSAAI